MSLIYGPFNQVNFCNASVISFQSSIGWNQESSSVTISLVEDPKLKQRFSYPTVGTPMTFQFEGFKFRGLIQRYLKKNAADGMPTFEVTLTDPREILAGTQVILSSYRDSVGGFPNLLNAYGYWEDQLGFGGGMNNEAGMLWNADFGILNLSSSGNFTITKPSGNVGIMPAIHALTKKVGQFGGPLSLLGNFYDVDLSNLPIPPAYYRMGGVSSSILDMVSEICQDGGCDYICYLDDFTIRFKTVSRAQPNSPGQIYSFVTNKENIINNSLGVEMRNEITNSILLGGDICQLIQEFNPGGDQTIWPYWGKDFNEKIIMGKGDPSDEHKFDLNAGPIVDIVGQLTYPCDLVELRCALMDFDSWAFYLLKKAHSDKFGLEDPDAQELFKQKVDAIGLVCSIDSTSDFQDIFPNTIFSHDLLAEDDDTAKQFGMMNESDYWTQRVQRVYEYVRQYASEYFGKKFLVKIPFNIYWKAEADTTHIVASDEPTDAGYLPEGSSPLGLEYLNENTFLTQDGRFQCFVKVTGTTNPDVQRLSPESVIIQGEDIYMRAGIDTEVGIVYPPDTIFPYCVVTLDSQIYEAADCPLGNLEDIAKLLELDTVDNLRDFAAGIRHDSFPFKIHPAPYRPDAVALPMKSNRDSYGPWYTASGADGKVLFERDESLVPWNYGDMNTMNQAAMAKLANSATSQQSIDTGTVELAGAPEHSLGDELVGGGPQLTGIDVSIGQGGVTTSYRMETFTPRFGRFTKENAERMRRLGLAAMDMRRSVRNLFQKNAANQRTVQSATYGFMANTSRAVRQATPHQCLLGVMIKDDKYGYRSLVSTQTAPELIANIRGDKEDVWKFTGAMTLQGLLRPFSTNTKREVDDTANDMPHYEPIIGDVDYKISRDEFDPFTDKTDVEYLAYGDEYPGSIHTLKQPPELDNCRPLGLRGPLIQVGWGYSYTGKPIPNKDDDPNADVVKYEHQWSDDFLEDYRVKSEKWKAGPIGLYWDNWRKMWTIPTFLFGTADEPIGESGGMVSIDVGGKKLPDKVKAFNWLGGTIKKDQKVCIGYYQQQNQWRVVSAGCA